MKIEITDEMIADWLETHKEDYQAIINKKIDRAIKDAINDAFNTTCYGDKIGSAFEIVDKQVKLIVNKAIEMYEIDTDEINRKLLKQINTKVKQATIDIKI